MWEKGGSNCVLILVIVPKFVIQWMGAFKSVWNVQLIRRYKIVCMHPVCAHHSFTVNGAKRNVCSVLYNKD